MVGFGAQAAVWVAVLGIAAMLMGTTVSAAEPAKANAPFRYDSRGRRDPFLALVRDGHPVGIVDGAKVAGGEPVLYGILWDPGGASLALINDREMRVGETVGAYTIQEIRQDAVVLSNGGEPLELRLVFEAVSPPSHGDDDTTTRRNSP